MKKEKPYEIHFIDDEAVLRLQIAIVEQLARIGAEQKPTNENALGLKKLCCRVGGSF